ncbi:MAG TPA: sigma-70 family RNA polymerase sigma factor [Thermoanaerobaculia bacterium]|nr:sigma-70 family RNA polymerase sigma factor [Thermoanaerobaculia bacterium]
MTPDAVGRGRFATTQWSLVLAAARGGAGDGEALARLCSLYWYPVYAFVRRQVRSADEALDLTQSFFTRLLEKGDLGQADPERGRFRSFLLASCRHFISNERDREHAIKRGGGTAAVPIDLVNAEGRYERALTTHETPDRLYERQWALTLMDLVLESVRDEYVEAGNERLFDRLRACITDTEGTQAEAARELGMSVPAVKMAVHRLRKRYRKALRQRVSDTLDTPDGVDDEIRHLMSMVVL